MLEEAGPHGEAVPHHGVVRAPRDARRTRGDVEVGAARLALAEEELAGVAALAVQPEGVAGGEGRGGVVRRGLGLGGRGGAGRQGAEEQGGQQRPATPSRAQPTLRRFRFRKSIMMYCPSVMVVVK